MVFSPGATVLKIGVLDSLFSAENPDFQHGSVHVLRTYKGRQFVARGASLPLSRCLRVESTAVFRNCLWLFPFHRVSGRYAMHNYPSYGLRHHFTQIPRRKPFESLKYRLPINTLKGLGLRPWFGRGRRPPNLAL